jgi:hypothetical protein
MKDFLKEKLDLPKNLLNTFGLDDTHTVIIESNLIKITNSTGEEILFSFNQQDYNDEIDEIKSYDNFLVVGADFINVILLDPYGSLKDFDPEHVLKIDGPYKGNLIKKINYGLQFTNLKGLIEEQTWEHLMLIANSPVDLADLYKSNLFVLEIQNAPPELLENEYLINKVINSILVHLAYKENVYLEIYKDFFVTNFSSVAQIENLEYIESQNSEPLLYFLSAEKITHPHLKYLEYYHVIEYFFLHSSINKISNIIDDLFTLKLSRSSQPSKEIYAEKLIDLYNLYGKNQKTTEDEQIRIVINEFLGFNKIKLLLIQNGFKINDIKNSIFENPETKLDLSGIVDQNGFLESVSADNQTKFCNEIAKRIYRIRNFIVHTKKGEKKLLFTPTNKNFDLLKYDLIFIRIISFSLITATSN